MLSRYHADEVSTECEPLDGLAVVDARSSSATVRRVPGHRRSAAFAAGAITKRRSVARGCGNELRCHPGFVAIDEQIEIEFARRVELASRTAVFALELL
jgi:hypothetical protein